jgi:hypothetical protein
MSQKIPHVYLSGLISIAAHDLPNTWHETVEQNLFGVCTFTNPTARNLYTVDKFSNLSEYVLKKNIEALKKSDILLVNLKYTHCISIESMLEIAWAALAQKNIVLVVDEHNIHTSDLLLSEDCVSFVTDNMDDACAYLTSYADGKAAVHDRSFPVGNSRSFNVLVQIIQTLSLNDESLLLNLRGHSHAVIDVLFLLALAYKMNVRSALHLKEGSAYDHPMLRAIVDEIKTF